MAVETDTLDAPEVPFESALSERYLVYALSTITARSLPDVRDGLKPVHRRLLWAMRLLRLDPTQGYKKCARVVGDVIGKYHPHGDASVYDAMVRLAQTFALRYPLVDGQGNFGNIDGDNAAAYRYTEARLTQVAIDLMDGLDENAVDFRPTYNGEDEEPELFPGMFPNLLANGAAGIAVGMATSIPPHNAAELMQAAVALIDNPDADVLEFVQGPDFPTAGIVVDSARTIAEAYATGRGSFRVRAKIDEVREKGGGWHLVVTEIPYGVQKGKLIEQIAALITEKKLPILADVRDESFSFLLDPAQPRAVFTGDVLLIRGSGRTDFQNGDAEKSWDSIVNKLFHLPDETLVYPAHDYKGWTASSIGEEKRHNPRLAGKTRAQYVEIMRNLRLPNPKLMDVAVPANLACGQPERVISG